MNQRHTTRYILSQITTLIKYLVESVEFFPRNTITGVYALVPEHTLRSLPGEFSALNVVAIMNAAFQQFAPGTDVGIDLARKYEAAVQMKG